MHLVNLPWKVTHFAESILQTLISHRWDTQPLLCKIMSEGGMRLYLRTAGLSVEFPEKFGFFQRNIAAYAFDSCPNYFDLDSTTNAFAVGWSRIGRRFAWAMWAYAFGILYLISLIPGMLKRVPYLRTSYLNKHRESLMSKYFGSKHQLYLCGGRDRICDAKYILSWAQKQQTALGPDRVQMHCWEHCGHVLALRDHAEEYSKKIDDLIALAMPK